LSSFAENPLNVEFTILDGKLHREELQFNRQPSPHILYSTLYEDAVSKPFPDRGKEGLSIFVGRAEQFLKSEVPLLWQLEKKRGRQRMVVVTNLRGNGFVPAFRKVESSLGDPLLVPVSFLRRRGKRWDSLDFFSHGTSRSMEGAAPRLKRLKQRGWELVADRLSQTDRAIKSKYFETLELERGEMQASFLDGLANCRLSAMVGIAGQCLQKQHLGGLLQEDLLSQILVATQAAAAPVANSGWRFLSKRRSAAELLLAAEGEQWVEEGSTLVGQALKGERKSEFCVSKILQRLQCEFQGKFFTLIRVNVDWRYRPVSEIPVYWTQNSTSPAGS